MHRVDFSHLEAPADFTKGKKTKIFQVLDIKGQFEGEKLVFSLEILALPSLLCISGYFI